MVRRTQTSVAPPPQRGVRRLFVVPRRLFRGRAALRPRWLRRAGTWTRVGIDLLRDSLLWAWWQARSLIPRRVPAHWVGGGAEHSATGLRRPTILLIPGLATNWQFLRPLAEPLVAAGFRVRVIPHLGRMSRLSDELAQRVVRLVRTHREWGPVVIVAHSKGGLVAKHAMLCEPAIAGAVTISTPYAGASAALLVRGYSARMRNVVMLRPGTPALEELAQQTAVDARIVTISPIIDEIVGGRGALPGARNYAVSSIGHNRLLADARVHTLVITEARRLLRTHATTPPTAV